MQLAAAEWAEAELEWPHDTFPSSGPAAAAAEAAEEEEEQQEEELQ